MKNEKWIVLASQGIEWRTRYEVLLLDSIKEVEEVLLTLKEKKTKTNQSYLEFSEVFEPGSLYPVTYKAFKEEEQKRQERPKNGIADFFVQFHRKNGSLFQKEYEWYEDLEYRLDDCEEKGISDIILLKTDEGTNANTFFKFELPKLKKQAM